MKTNGFVQKIKLPITFEIFIVGAVTTVRNTAANSYDGAEAYYIVDLATVNIASGSSTSPAAYIMIGF